MSENTHEASLARQHRAEATLATPGIKERFAPTSAYPPQPTLSPRNKGPILRKAIEAFYFASKAHALLHSQSDGTARPIAGLPRAASWIPQSLGGDNNRCGLLSAYYPEVGTLVMAYAATDSMVKEADLETNKQATPFYLPNSWNTTGLKPVVEAFNALHQGQNASTHSDPLQAAKELLYRCSDSQEPLRIIVTGFGAGGGGIAALAAPFIAAAYPSADSRLVTFRTPRVRSDLFMRLTEHTVGVRIPINVQNDPLTSHKEYGEDKPPGISIQTVKLELKTSQLQGGASLPLGSLASYFVALKDRYTSIVGNVYTSGSKYVQYPFAAGSFWGLDELALVQPLLAAATIIPTLTSMNGVAQFLNRWANKELKLTGGGGIEGSSYPQAPQNLNAPGFVALPFSLLPGPTFRGSLDLYLKALVLAQMDQSSIYAEAAYSTNVIPQEFIQKSGWPKASSDGSVPFHDTSQLCTSVEISSSNDESKRNELPGWEGVNVTYLADPLVGTNVFVAWHKPTGTLLFSFRGTEPNEFADLFTDADFLQFKADLIEFFDFDDPSKGTRSSQSTEGHQGLIHNSSSRFKHFSKSVTCPIATISGHVPTLTVAGSIVPSADDARTHRGFLRAFRAIAGMPSFAWSDLLVPISSFVQSIHAVTKYLLPSNVRPSSYVDPPIYGPNIAEAAALMSDGRAPLRVVCCGHSLGGALATIASVWASLTYPSADIRCITFGTPFVGNQAFVETWRELVGFRLCAIHGNDVVAAVPSIGFKQTYPVVWLRPGREGGEKADMEMHEQGLRRPWVNGRDCRFGYGIVDHMMRNGYVATMDLVKEWVAREYIKAQKVAVL